MNLALIKLLFLIIGILGSFILSYIVFKSNKKGSQNKLFLLMSLFGSLWLIFAYLSGYDTNLSRATIWSRLNFGAVSIFMLLSYYFVVEFFKKFKVNKKIGIIFFCLSILLFSIASFTNLVIVNVQRQNWGNMTQYGRLWLEYVVCISLIGSYSVYLLIRKYSLLGGIDKKKVKFFLIGVVFFFTGNLIFNANKFIRINPVDFGLNHIILIPNQIDRTLNGYGVRIGNACYIVFGDSLYSRLKTRLIQHEYLHGIINPEFEKTNIKKLVEETKDLFNQFVSSSIKKHYHEWSHVLVEYIIRSIVGWTMNPTMRERNLCDEESRNGFVKIRYFDQHRDTYVKSKKSFIEYIPKLLMDLMTSSPQTAQPKSHGCSKFRD